jgi:hypothetical protein
MAQFRYEVCAPSVVGEVIDGEAIIMNLHTGVYYSTSGLGAVIWQGVEEGVTRGAVLGWTQAAYGDAATADVTAFLDGLLDRSLIRLADGDATAALPPAPAVYGAPVLAVHEDMQDLIQLDPIHEVAEMGWPVRKVEA